MIPGYISVVLADGSLDEYTLSIVSKEATRQGFKRNNLACQRGQKGDEEKLKMLTVHVVGASEGAEVLYERDWDEEAKDAIEEESLSEGMS